MAAPALLDATRRSMSELAAISAISHARAARGAEFEAEGALAGTKHGSGTDALARERSLAS